MIERKVGEVFEVNGEWFIVERVSNCKNCHFHGKECVANFRLKNFGECSTTKRSNSTSVSFVKLEKEEEKEVSATEISDVIKKANGTIETLLKDVERLEKVNADFRDIIERNTSNNASKQREIFSLKDALEKKEWELEKALIERNFIIELYDRFINTNKRKEND